MGNKSNKDPNLFAKHVFDNLLDKLDLEAAKEKTPKSETKDLKKQAAERKGSEKGNEVRTNKQSSQKKKTA